jgi:hypothetical protein
MENWILKNLGSTSDPSGLSVIVSIGHTLLEGIVFTVDLVNSTLILQVSKGFSIISIPHVKSIKVLDVPKVPIVNLKNLPLEKLLLREEMNLALMKLENNKIGIGVSVRGQLIFDELSKTLPTYWSNTDIIVLDEIIIVDPYTSESCSTLKGSSESSLVRVRKVLTNILTKLERSESLVK